MVAEKSWKYEPGQDAPGPQADNDNKPAAITATPFELQDPASLPQREWLFGRHYIRKFMTATFGAGGGGKSSHAITEVLAMVTGRPLLDRNGPLSTPLRVWYVNAEDPRDEIKRRFHAAAIQFGITNEQIGGRLFTDTGREQEFIVVRQDGRETKIVDPVIEGIVAEIERNKIDAMIIDPFVSTHEVEENDNGKIQRVAKIWTSIADYTNCSIELIHHVTKGNLEITADSGRGAGALKDKARSVRTINAMTHKQAEAAGVDDPFDYFRVDFGKANLAKRSTRSDWRRFETVNLGNGKGLGNTRGDAVGVVVPWNWPSADSLAERAANERAATVADVPEEMLAGLKVRLDNADHKASDQATSWAGNVVAEIFGIDLEIKAERKRVKDMLAAWVEAGELQIVRIPDAHRRMTPHVKPGCGTTENEVPQV